jgi:hypothetical protein
MNSGVQLRGRIEVFEKRRAHKYAAAYTLLFGTVSNLGNPARAPLNV